MKDLATQNRLSELQQELALELKHLRHVRILFMDTMGQLTIVSPQPESGARSTQAPRWFAALVRPQIIGRAVRVVAIDHANPVIIIGEPSDEIAEAWRDFSSLAIVWLILNALILLILYVVLGRASSIQTLANQRPDGRTAEITRRVGEILSITERLKLMNRALLKKLRPGPLGRVKLSALLDELIAGFQRRHPDTHVMVNFGKLADSYGEGIDLTLYRCIQEGITNAIRHGKASNLSVDLFEEPPARSTGSKKSGGKLSLTLSDDGKGIAPSTPKGFGLTTMAERVRSLGGSCVIESARSRGTTIHVEIPVHVGKEKKARMLELVGELS